MLILDAKVKIVREVAARLRTMGIWAQEQLDMDCVEVWSGPGVGRLLCPCEVPRTFHPRATIAEIEVEAMVTMNVSNIARELAVRVKAALDSPSMVTSAPTPPSLPSRPPTPSR